jgi:competence protein ComEA
VDVDAAFRCPQIDVKVTIAGAVAHGESVSEVSSSASEVVQARLAELFGQLSDKVPPAIAESAMHAGHMETDGRHTGSRTRVVAESADTQSIDEAWLARLRRVQAEGDRSVTAEVKPSSRTRRREARSWNEPAQSELNRELVGSRPRNSSADDGHSDYDESESVSRWREARDSQSSSGGARGGGARGGESLAGESLAGEPRKEERRWPQIAERAVAFTREHLATVAVVLLVGVAWTAYSLYQVRSLPVAGAAASVDPSASIDVSASPAAADQLIVHVIGAVNRPGVVKLPSGSRVSDAIDAVGGLTSDAAVGELNLAQVLTDGTQLKIGNRKSPGAWLRVGAETSSATGTAGTGGTGTGTGTTSSADSSKVSLNTATVQQLDTLPGIGPVTAQKIIDWRTAHGKFSSLAELQEVDGIGPKTYADLADRVRL